MIYLSDNLCKLLLRLAFSLKNRGNSVGNVIRPLNLKLDVRRRLIKHLLE